MKRLLSINFAKFNLSQSIIFGAVTTIIACEKPHNDSYHVSYSIIFSYFMFYSNIIGIRKYRTKKNVSGKKYFIKWRRIE